MIFDTNVGSGFRASICLHTQLSMHLRTGPPRFSAKEKTSWLQQSFERFFRQAFLLSGLEFPHT